MNVPSAPENVPVHATPAGASVAHASTNASFTVEPASDFTVPAIVAPAGSLRSTPALSAVMAIFDAAERAAT